MPLRQKKYLQSSRKSRTFQTCIEHLIKVQDESQMQFWAWSSSMAFLVGQESSTFLKSRSNVQMWGRDTRAAALNGGVSLPLPLF